MSVATGMAIGVASSGLGRSIEVISKATPEQNLYGFLFAVAFWAIFLIVGFLIMRSVGRRQDEKFKKDLEDIRAGRYRGGV